MIVTLLVCAVHPVPKVLPRVFLLLFEGIVMGQVLDLTLLTQVSAQCLKENWFPQILKEVRKSTWDLWSDCAVPESSVVWQFSASFLDRGHISLPL